MGLHSCQNLTNKLNLFYKYPMSHECIYKYNKYIFLANKVSLTI